MAFPSGIDFAGSFNLNTNLLRLTDLTNYTGNGSGWVAYYTALGPDGSYFWIGNETTPDTTQSIPLIKDILLPTDGKGNVLTGLYVITISQYKAGITHTITKSVSVTIVKPTVVLDFTYNQFESSVVVTDNTAYIQDGITPSNNISIQLTYPSGLSYDPYPSYPTPLSTISNPLSVIYDKTAGDGLFVKGKYTYSMTGSSVYTLGNGFNVYVLNSASKTITPTVTYNMAAMYCCLKNLKARMDSLLKVNLTLYDIEKDKYTSAIQLMEMIRDSYISNQLTDCENYISEFYRVTGCTDDCCTDCSEDNSVQLVVPISFEEHVEVVSVSPSLVITKTTEKTGLNNFYTQFSLELNNGTNNAFQKIVYLDPNGDDDTGIIGSVLYPYKTFTRVNEFIDSSYLVIVNPGNYNETLPFNSNATYYLYKNVILTCFNGCSMSYSPTVYGDGIINSTSFIIDGLAFETFSGKFYFDTLTTTTVFNTITNSKIINPLFSCKSLFIYNSFNNNVLKQSTSGTYLKLINTNIIFQGSGSLFNLGVVDVDVTLCLENTTIFATDPASKIYNTVNNTSIVHKNVRIRASNTRVLYGTVGSVIFYNDNNCFSNVNITTESTLDETAIAPFIIKLQTSKLLL
jgi:hypothetical protein